MLAVRLVGDFAILSAPYEGFCASVGVSARASEHGNEVAGEKGATPKPLSRYDDLVSRTTSGAAAGSALDPSSEGKVDDPLAGTSRVRGP